LKRVTPNIGHLSLSAQESFCAVPSGNSLRGETRDQHRPLLFGERGEKSGPRKWDLWRGPMVSNQQKTGRWGPEKEKKIELEANNVPRVVVVG